MDFSAVDSWFDSEFKIQKTKSSKVSSKKKSITINSGGYRQSSKEKIANIKSVLKKSPEVVVKITGASKGTKGFKSHIDYITRNGKLELEDERGNISKGVESLRDLRNEQKSIDVPFEGKNNEYIHVMFSMPKNTPENQLRKAVANFCKVEFSNRSYLMAFHSDTMKPHVHVCVSTRNMDFSHGKRLSPRKKDLQRWRQGFAEKLREQGIEAAASNRFVRGNFRKSTKSSIIQQQTPRIPKVHQKMIDEVRIAVLNKKRPVNPAQESIEKLRDEISKQWYCVEKESINSNDPEANSLIKEVKNMAETIKKTKITSITQNLYDLNSEHISKSDVQIESR
jgi:hypothetical protein